MGIIVRTTNEDDWGLVRELRLEMLLDTPIAFLETHRTALAHDEREWRMRAARGGGHDSTLVLAIDEASGRPVGTMGGYRPKSSTVPYLVGVYVSPPFRGSKHGVTDALLEVIEEWAAQHGNVLRLHVHEENPRARAYYERHGFALTGATEPYPLAPGGLELEMIKRL